MKRQRPQRALVAGQGGEGTKGQNVPEHYRLVVACGGEEETTELFVGDRWIAYPWGREVAIAFSPKHTLPDDVRARLNAFLASGRALR